MKGAGVKLLRIEKIMKRQEKCRSVAGSTVVFKLEGRGLNPGCGELHVILIQICETFLN